MPKAISLVYENLSPAAQKEADDFIEFLASREEPKKNSQSPFLKYCGVLDDEDAKIMMTAASEC